MNANAPNRNAPSTNTENSTTRAHGFTNTCENSKIMRRTADPSSLRVMRVCAGSRQFSENSTRLISTKPHEMPKNGTRQLR
jgi:hypothetical protein